MITIKVFAVALLFLCLATVMFAAAPVRAQGPGDVDEDGDVDIFDVQAAIQAFGSVQGGPNWNANADLASPYGVIDILDLVTIGRYYGNHYA
jgi:hypothetical protein